MNKKLTKQLSKWSVGLSAICAVHCVLTPIAVLTMSFSTMGGDHTGWEIALLLGSFLLALTAVITSIPKHGNYLPLLLMAPVAVLFLLSLFFHLHLASMFGSFLLAFALYRNWKLGHSCTTA